MKRVPNEIKNLYDFLGFFDRAYLALRWRLCPFTIIEKFLPKEGKIVDVGCGYGLLANLLAIKSEKRDVYGFDLSRRRINIAKRSIKARKNVHFEVKHVRDLRLNSCDAIVMSDFLHHVPYKEQRNLVRQAYSKLKKNGVIIIQDVDRRPLWKYCMATSIDRILNPFSRLYYIDIKAFEAMLQKNGFMVTVIRVDKNLPLPDVLFVCRKK